MPNEFKMRHSSAALMAALAAVFPLSGQAAGAARVDFATGDVKALSPDGRSRTLDKGAEIGSGETIDTGNGRAQVRFTDGAQVSLQPQTQFRIDDYRFSGKADGSEKGFFSLLRGGLRTITGLVGRTNRDNYKVTTTVATIGIRGTEFSVAYGNSISVTTGEGIVQVCNAAGCLIVNSGESAVVTDNNTQPLMTNKKTELPPSQPDSVLPAFISGNGASGGFPVLPSGPGYSMAMAGHYYDSGEFYDFIAGPGSDSRLDGKVKSTAANFDGSGALASFNSIDGGEGALAVQGVSAGALSDGIIGWGRWTSGSQSDWGSSPYGLKEVHYVVGIPTSAVEMAAIGGTVGTYALSGFTYPTAYNSSTGITTVGTLPVSGSLTANFGGGSVSGNLNIPLAGNNYGMSWSGLGISGSNFSGSGSVSGGSCSGCTSSIQGFFAGAAASRAGLVYNFGAGGSLGTVSGAAVFTKTSSSAY
jgi:hypothetical protein